MTASLRQVVSTALDRAWVASNDAHGMARPPDLAGHLATEVRDGLKAAGFSIHRSGECVHPHTRPGDLGREMTEAERQAVGL